MINYKNYKKLSFKLTEIGGENNPIYLSRINEVQLIKDNSFRDKLKLILILCSLILILIITFIIIYLQKIQPEFKGKKFSDTIYQLVTFSRHNNPIESTSKQKIK